MRPPSLEPSTPDVSEPSEWIMRGSGYRLATLESRQDRVNRRVVAQASGVQDHVVVGGVVAVVAVDLLDVRRPVLVRLLHAASRLIFRADVEPRHDRLDASGLRPAEK